MQLSRVLFKQDFFGDVIRAIFLPLKRKTENKGTTAD